MTKYTCNLHIDNQYAPVISPGVFSRTEPEAGSHVGTDVVHVFLYDLHINDSNPLFTAPWGHQNAIL